MRKHARTICMAGLGIALYVALSFVAILVFTLTQCVPRLLR